MQGHRHLGDSDIPLSTFVLHREQQLLGKQCLNQISTWYFCQSCFMILISLIYERFWFDKMLLRRFRRSSRTSVNPEKVGLNAVNILNPSSLHDIYWLHSWTLAVKMSSLYRFQVQRNHHSYQFSPRVCHCQTQNSSSLRRKLLHDVGVRSAFSTNTQLHAHFCTTLFRVTRSYSNVKRAVHCPSFAFRRPHHFIPVPSQRNDWQSIREPDHDLDYSFSSLGTWGYCWLSRRGRAEKLAAGALRGLRGL